MYNNIPLITCVSLDEEHFRAAGKLVEAIDKDDDFVEEVRLFLVPLVAYLIIHPIQISSQSKTQHTND